MKPYLFLALFVLFTSAASAQIFGKTYNPGAYYTADGEKHVGLLAMNFDPPGLFGSPDNTIFFKADNNADREKIKVSTIKSFIVSNKDTARTDSFVVIHNPKLSRIKYDYDIIQVLHDGGPVKLYNYKLKRKVGAGFGMSIMVTATVTYYDNYYYYGDTADTAVEMKKKDFVSVMSKILEDDPSVVRKIQNFTYTMGKMHEVIKIYNANKLKTASM